MSTPDAQARPKKHFTTAEIEAALAATPHVPTPLTCQQLCEEIQNDMNDLQNLEDYPANLRARVATFLKRDIITLRNESRAQHCPDCLP